MNFLQSLWRSLYDFNWMANQRFASVSRALGFFSLVVLVVTAARTAPTIFFALPPFVDEFAHTYTTQVPDFEAGFVDNKLNITKLPQPYIHDGVYNDTNYKIYIDTVSTSTPTMSQLIEGKTYTMAVLLNRDELQMYDGEAKSTEIINFADAFEAETGLNSTTTISKALIQEKITSFQEKVMPYVPTVLFVLLVLAMWVVKFIAVLFWSLIFMWLAQSMGKQWSYGDLFKIVLYAAAVPMIINAVLQWIGVTVPLLGTVLLVLVVYLAIKADEIEKKPQP